MANSGAKALARTGATAPESSGSRPKRSFHSAAERYVMVPTLRARRMPARGGWSTGYCPPCQAGSDNTASRCTARSAMARGDAASDPEMLNSRLATPGNSATKATATMPPSEGPATVCTWSRPS